MTMKSDDTFDDLSLTWPSSLRTDQLVQVIELVDSTASDGGTLGFARPMTLMESDNFQAALHHKVGTGEVHALLGTYGGQLVFFCLLTQSVVPNCCHRAELTKGVVRPSHRGRNIIPRVFRKIVDRCAQLGVEQLVLDVRANSRAHDLWQRFGFESFGVLEDYARVDGQSFRGHFMTQTVDALRQRLSALTPPDLRT